jgi:hypothetical protein
VEASSAAASSAATAMCFPLQKESSSHIHLQEVYSPYIFMAWTTLPLPFIYAITSVWSA